MSSLDSIMFISNYGFTKWKGKDRFDLKIISKYEIDYVSTDI